MYPRRTSARLYIASLASNDNGNGNDNPDQQFQHSQPAQSRSQKNSQFSQVVKSHPRTNKPSSPVPRYEQRGKRKPNDDKRLKSTTSLSSLTSILSPPPDEDEPPDPPDPPPLHQPSPPLFVGNSPPTSPDNPKPPRRPARIRRPSEKAATLLSCKAAKASESVAAFTTTSSARTNLTPRNKSTMPPKSGVQKRNKRIDSDEDITSDSDSSLSSAPPSQPLPPDSPVAETKPEVVSEETTRGKRKRARPSVTKERAGKEDSLASSSTDKGSKSPTKLRLTLKRSESAQHTPQDTPAPKSPVKITLKLSAGTNGKKIFEQSVAGPSDTLEREEGNKQSTKKKKKTAIKDEEDSERAEVEPVVSKTGGKGKKRESTSTSQDLPANETTARPKNGKVTKESSETAEGKRRKRQAEDEPKSKKVERKVKNSRDYSSSEDDGDEEEETVRPPKKRKSLLKQQEKIASSPIPGPPLPSTQVASDSNIREAEQTPLSTRGGTTGETKPAASPSKSTAKILPKMGKKPRPSEPENQRAAITGASVKAEKSDTPGGSAAGGKKEPTRAKTAPGPSAPSEGEDGSKKPLPTKKPQLKTAQSGTPLGKTSSIPGHGHGMGLLGNTLALLQGTGTPKVKGDKEGKASPAPRIGGKKGGWGEDFALTPEQEKEYAASKEQREAERKQREAWRVDPVNLQEGKDAIKVDSMQPRSIAVPGAMGIQTKGKPSEMLAAVLGF